MLSEGCGGFTGGNGLGASPLFAFAAPVDCLASDEGAGLVLPDGAVSLVPLLSDEAGVDLPSDDCDGGFDLLSGWAAAELPVFPEEAGGEPEDLLSDEAAGALALPSGGGAAALGEGVGDALSPLPAMDDAPSPADAPSALAKAGGTAKSSDTSAAKRNNLFIITPPDTLTCFF
jgi:hypothetical protein